MDALLKLGIVPWNIVVYMANAGFMIAVLTFLLYKPLFRFIDERRKKISDSVHAAERYKEELDAKIKESKEEREKAETELRDEMAKLHKFVETKRAELTEEMQTARTEMLQKAQDEIDRKKASLIKDAEKEITALMTKIILDIVRNKVPESVVQESIHDSWKQIKKSA